MSVTVRRQTPRKQVGFPSRAANLARRRLSACQVNPLCKLKHKENNLPRGLLEGTLIIIRARPSPNRYIFQRTPGSCGTFRPSYRISRVPKASGATRPHDYSIISRFLVSSHVLGASAACSRSAPHPRSLLRNI